MSLSLEEAAQALVTKLKQIHDDPQYKSVWVMLHIHGGKYTGPNYAEELAALEKALQEKK